MDYGELAAMAVKAKEMSYSPYSRFRVGAALLTREGKVYLGCNIENAAYSPANCAERTAFFKAVSEGDLHFKAIAIAGGREGERGDFCYPCGVCRQVMAEFCSSETFDVVVADDGGVHRVYKLADLLPHGFGPSSLGFSKKFE